MGKLTDIKVKGVEVYFLPIKTRMPLKFGKEVVTSVCCARVCVEVEDRNGKRAKGWGETPLSVQWAWPSDISYEIREKIMKEFCIKIAERYFSFEFYGHPVEIGYFFQKEVLSEEIKKLNEGIKLKEEFPYLAGLICCSPFDIAIHDAYGNLHEISVYNTYNQNFMNLDLSYFLKDQSFKNMYPEDFLLKNRREELYAWHLVGGLDPLDESELKGDQPSDGYPVTLCDWIIKDGLKCLKVKLKGIDDKWDYERMVKVGNIALKYNVEYLSCDFNCMVKEVSYVNEILDRLKREHPEIYDLILYVEQPFPYELEKYKIDVTSVAKRKPIFLDESAHTWELVKLGKELGWNGVALKTCKTQTNALLTLSWAKFNNMYLMVQDLTNPMLAQIPHVLLASYIQTIMGVETNSMQYYPEASIFEEKVHPGIYKRKNGKIYLHSIKGYGFGYRIEEIERKLPEAEIILKK